MLNFLNIFTRYFKFRIIYHLLFIIYHLPFSLWKINMARSVFSQDCIDYIYAARQDTKHSIASCSHIVEYLEKYNERISDQDERDICSYMLSSLSQLKCMNPTNHNSCTPVLLRIQTLCGKRIERTLTDNVKIDQCLTDYYIATEKRSLFAHNCIQYIAASEVDTKIHINAAAHIVETMKRESQVITIHDQREVYGYILRNVPRSYEESDKRLAKPLLTLVQDFLNQLIDDSLKQKASLIRLTTPILYLNSSYLNSSSLIPLHLKDSAIKEKVFLVETKRQENKKAEKTDKSTTADTLYAATSVLAGKKNKFKWRKMNILTGEIL